MHFLCAKGDDVSVHYDPMIAKLIVWGSDRIEAIKKADLALAEFNVGGVETNVDFMRRILQSSAFRHKLVTTKFIEENHDELMKQEKLTAEQLAMATLALSAIQDHIQGERFLKRFRLNSDIQVAFPVNDVLKAVQNINVIIKDSSEFSVLDQENCRVLKTLKSGNSYQLEILVNGVTKHVTATLGDGTLHIFSKVNAIYPSCH